MKRNTTLYLDYEAVQTLIRNLGDGNLSNHVNNFLLNELKVLKSPKPEMDLKLINVKLMDEIEKLKNEIETLKKQLKEKKESGLNGFRKAF